VLSAELERLQSEVGICVRRLRLYVAMAVVLSSLSGCRCSETTGFQTTGGCSAEPRKGHADQQPVVNEKLRSQGAVVVVGRVS
jgi:hypothetical protein